MPAIHLLFLWHMHQPYYKDLVTGEYRLPWVRLHALKDYYGMIKLLDEFPGVHQTFNLVPSLMVQIQDYVNGSARDAFLDVAAKPAAELNPAERQFALQYLFQAQFDRMIGRYPRYHELWERFHSSASDVAQVALLLTEADITDLQVLSQIAWFDEYFLQEPELRELVKKGRNYTLEDQNFVIHKQRQMLAQVLPAYAAAARRGTIEISTSPFYHPILPLVCDTDIGAVSHPGLTLPRQRFCHPEDALTQIVRGMDLHEEIFGIRPQGMWPSEGSVSNDVLALAHTAGLRWVATDEGVLGRSLGWIFQRESGKLSTASAERLYRIYQWDQGDATMKVLFRDHSLSDLIGFVYAAMPAREAASDFIRRVKEGAAPLLAGGKDVVVPIILDGENAWEYYPHSGREFLRCLYDTIQKDKQFEALTISEAITREQSAASMPSMVPGSWINANFDVWIGAPEDNLAWDHLSAARDFFSKNAEQVSLPQRDLAFEELLIAEGSDWNWWYGPEHHSANDREFDQLYRKHLSNVYQALGAAPPDVLAQPIIGSHVKPSFTPQTDYISPRLEGPHSGYFDWLGAASHTAERRSSAMHGKVFLLDTGYVGINDRNLYCRLDFMEKISEWSTAETKLVTTIESLDPIGDQKHTYRLEADISPSTGSGILISDWGLKENGTGAAQQAGICVRLREESIFECQIPLKMIAANLGTLLRIRFSLWRDRLPLDALPEEGSIEV
ncbi:MAG TPA: glycoside hydrolase family 57 protein, partial [Candidatus Solibacter sp.]|nr:glycoside hydrolase family 57 protein [Candidatus Solibacter sp.]